MTKKNTTIIERLTRLETLMENHLHYHSHIARYLLLPILVGVVILVVKSFFKIGG